MATVLWKLRQPMPAFKNLLTEKKETGNQLLLENDGVWKRPYPFQNYFFDAGMEQAASMGMQLA